MTVKAGIIRLLHKEFDVCEEAYVLKVSYLGSYCKAYLRLTSTQAQCEHYHPMSGREGSSQGHSNCHLAERDPSRYVHVPCVVRWKAHPGPILAQFSVNIRGYTEEDEDLVCMDLMMDFGILPRSFLPW